MKKNNTKEYYTPIQLKMPIDLERIIDISDAVYTFNEVMEHIDPSKYIAEEKGRRMGRPRYDLVILLKVVLFAFMEFGYCSVRRIEQLCKTDIRFMWLLNGLPTPSFMTIENFMKKYLQGELKDIAAEINQYIFEEESVDLQHAYLDGTKIEASANKYSWVWKKSCIRNRNKMFSKLNELLPEVNEHFAMYKQAKLEKREEYTIEYVEYMLRTFMEAAGLREEEFVHGSGKRKSREQKLYEQLKEYSERLKKYAEQINMCGEGRNSYSKTDHDATFMRVKKDHMGNDQLLPAYNFQIMVCDEYIAMYGAYPYASDSDCFQPMMELFHERYGFYPRYPVTDAGYGSFNNYLYCQEHEMEKYMKFSMYEKQSKDAKYRDNPYRVQNFKIDSEGNMICPQGKRFVFLRTKPIKGNQYGRTEELYQCEDCEGCPYRERCHKSKGNRIIQMNRELTSIHEEVLRNLNCTHGALLRMNRSIQAEGAFGCMKWNRAYNRLHRRSAERVNFEFGLLCCGFNLHKFHLKRQAQNAAA